MRGPHFAQRILYFALTQGATAYPSPYAPYTTHRVQPQGAKSHVNLALSLVLFHMQLSKIHSFVKHVKQRTPIPSVSRQVSPLPFAPKPHTTQLRTAVQ